MDTHDAEFQALLSAYAAGTLTDAERKRLFEKALDNQELFDQLMEEETMRAALESPFVKRALQNAIENAALPTLRERISPTFYACSALNYDLPKTVDCDPPKTVQIRRRPRWAYAALAACLVLASGGLYFWLRQPAAEPVSVAQAPPAPVAPVAEPEASRSTAVPAASPRSAPAPQAEQKMEPPAAAPSPPAAAESFAAPASTGPMPTPASPGSVPILPSAARRREAENQPQAPLPLTTRPGFRISQRTLSVPAAARGFVYLLRRDGEDYEAVEGFWPLVLTEATPLSFPLPEGVEGLLQLYFSETLDPLLSEQREFSVLPERYWQTLRVE
jgi:hypothetical protein